MAGTTRNSRALHLAPQRRAAYDEGGGEHGAGGGGRDAVEGGAEQADQLDGDLLEGLAHARTGR